MVIFHVLVCVLLVVVVLMQSSKGEGLAGAFGGGSGLTGAVFGGRGAASFLSKATTVLAIIFMINCGILAFMSSSRAGLTRGGSAATESAVTKEAAKELERQAQQQRQIPAGEMPGATDQTESQTAPATEPAGGEQTAPATTEGGK
jgi:preprotein translocase subunit SecG